MFIDEKGNLQFESLDELKSNKELAIQEFNNWAIPTVEEIEMQVVESIDVTLTTLQAFGLQESLGSTPEEILDNITQGMKMGVNTGANMVLSIFENDAEAEILRSRYNDFINRFYMACDNVTAKLMN